MTKNSKSTVNIPEKNYLSTLNEFEKACMPLTNIKQCSSSIEGFVNSVRSFGMDSTAVKLQKALLSFEELEKSYANVINYTHRQYNPEAKTFLVQTTSAIFQSMYKGIKILRIFHEFCKVHNIVDKQTVDVFLELTKRKGCTAMAVYVETEFFKSMQHLCHEFGTPKKENEKVCSVTVAYRSSKERLDKVNNKDITESHLEIKNFLDNWNIFLKEVVVFIIVNFLRLRDQNSSLCFQTFLDQQYQLVYEYHDKYNSYYKKLEAEKNKERIGLLWK